jgi:hypothetical protein
VQKSRRESPNQQQQASWPSAGHARMSSQAATSCMVKFAARSIWVTAVLSDCNVFRHLQYCVRASGSRATLPQPVMPQRPCSPSPGLPPHGALPQESKSHNQSQHRAVFTFSYMASCAWRGAAKAERATAAWATELSFRTFCANKRGLLLSSQDRGDAWRQVGLGWKGERVPRQ